MKRTAEANKRNSAKGIKVDVAKVDMEKREIGLWCGSYYFEFVQKGDQVVLSFVVGYQNPSPFIFNIAKKRAKAIFQNRSERIQKRNAHPQQLCLFPM